MSWGRNSYGNLGTGNTTNSSIPVAVNNLTDVVAIACGTNYSLAMTGNDSLFAFGRNTNGQLGNGTTNDAYTPAAVLSLCLTTGNDDMTVSDDQASIYPNPAKDELTIEISGNASVQIINAQGQLVKTAHISDYFNFLNIGELSNGIYMIKIIMNNELYTKKLIKQS